MNDQNKLADNIIETIEAMLTRPRMYVGDASDLEGQFFTLFTLVAPFRFGITQLEAGRALQKEVENFTGTNQGLSSTIKDVDALAKWLQVFYDKYAPRANDVSAN